jgi:hypothetical protein
MFGLETLDVIIGLITVYLTFGIACTALVEAWLALFGVRSKKLEASLKEMLDGNYNKESEAEKTFVDKFYDHPLVVSLSKGKDGRPSYIPKEIVGEVVHDLVLGGAAVQELKKGLDALPDTDATKRFKELMGSLEKRASGDVAKFCQEVEKHFDTVMERTQGWFKRHAQIVTLIVSTLLVIGANVDTIALVTSLYSDPAARLKMVEIAEQQLKEAKADEQVVPKQSDGSANLNDLKEKYWERTHSQGSGCLCNGLFRDAIRMERLS